MSDDTACLQCGSSKLNSIADYADFSAAASVATDERKPLHAYMEAHPHTKFREFIGCETCGFIRVLPVPTTETLMAFYQNYYANDSYSRKRDKKIKRTLKRLARLRPYVASGRFLDVGCNVGFAVEAAHRAGFTATGIEIDSSAVARATEQFPHNRYVANTIEEYVPDAPYDLVHCTEVIEHVTDPVAFAHHLARLTAPGGHLFLTTPDAGHWRRPRRFVAWPEVKPLEHISWQTRKSLSMLLNRQGFDIVRVAFNLKPGLHVVARRRA